MKRMVGFTLVEVLVAIAIFAVLSATGWVVLDQLIKNRDRNAQHAQRLEQLQLAYAQMLRDFSQAVPVVGVLGQERYPAMYLDGQLVRFNQAGVTDPLQQGLDSLQFVSYQYDAAKQAITRKKQAYIYRKQDDNQPADVVLTQVERFQVRALDPAPQLVWPPSSNMLSAEDTHLLAQLPAGVEISFDYQGVSYRWVYALVSSLPNLDEALSGKSTNPSTDPNKNAQRGRQNSSSQNSAQQAANNASQNAKGAP